MIEIRRATVEDIEGICRVCSDGQRVTYKDIETSEYIEDVIKEYYTKERVTKDVTEITHSWNGYFVAVEDGNVIGAGGGGFHNEAEAELYVLYVDPNRKGEGIGTNLLLAITKDHIERGAWVQWVSVTKNNTMGIPFYEKMGFEFVEEREDFHNPELASNVSLRYKRDLNLEML